MFVGVLLLQVLEAINLVLAGSGFAVVVGMVSGAMCMQV
jgi:hypothetical protein